MSMKEKYFVRVQLSLREMIRSTDGHLILEGVTYEDGGQCQFCGHRPIKYHFWVRDSETGQVRAAGSECIRTIFALDYRRERIFDSIVSRVLREVERVKNASRAELNAERWKEEMPEVYEYLKQRQALTPDDSFINSLLRAFETGTATEGQLNLIKRLPETDPLDKIRRMVEQTQAQIEENQLIIQRIDRLMNVQMGMYDDYLQEELLPSFREQALRGKKLSERQMKIIERAEQKYRQQLGAISASETVTEIVLER